MRNTFYLAIAATGITAHPLRSSFNNNLTPKVALDQGVLHYRQSDHPKGRWDHPHSSYPTHSWSYAERHGVPTWSRITTASTTSQPLTLSTPLSNSTASLSSQSSSNSTLTSANPPSSNATTTRTISTSPQIATNSTSSNSTLRSSNPLPSTSTMTITPAGAANGITTASPSSTSPSSNLRPSSATIVSTSHASDSSTATGVSTFIVSSSPVSDSSLPSVSNGPSIVPNQTRSAQPPSSTQSSGSYKAYCGDGSVSQGWPSMSQWLEFDYLFEQNEPNMKASCANWNVPDNSDEETNDLKTSILQVASLTGIDARFILAIVMQESTGCVRVITTNYAHLNPGLMQSWEGTGSCNLNQAPLGFAGTSESNVTTPCPYSEIHQMILDGTNGTAAPDSGLRQNFAQQGLNNAVGYYRTAKIYNGGLASFQANTNSLESGCCTTSYVSDIANRLTGWVNNAEREFSC